MEQIKISGKNTFLVTGGAGFIGSNLCEFLLELDQKVICLDDLSTGNYENIKNLENNDDFTFIEGSVTDLDTCIEATKYVDYVSHQAAWGSVPRSIEFPLLYEEKNIKGTLNMLEASKINNVKKFVYASSSSVYGDSEALPKVEGREGKVLSPYALTKKTNEEYAVLYSKLYGLKTIGLRYFNVFGRRQNPNGAYAAVIPKFIGNILENESIIINGDGTQSRDFTYIDNVLQANVKAMLSEENITGEVLNIAFGGRITLIDLLNEIQLNLGSNVEPIFSKVRAGDVRHSNADISKAKELILYNPEYDFNKGIKKTIEWYLNEKNKDTPCS